MRTLVVISLILKSKTKVARVCLDDGMDNIVSYGVIILSRRGNYRYAGPRCGGRKRITVSPHVCVSAVAHGTCAHGTLLVVSIAIHLVCIGNRSEERRVGKE